MREKIADIVLNMRYGNCNSDTVAKEIIAALPDMIKPLEWFATRDGTFHDQCYRYEIGKDGNYWKLVRAVTGGGGYLGRYSTMYEALTSANAHHAATITGAFE